MKKALLRLAAVLCLSAGASTVASAAGEDWCYANGAHCCDSTGWCLTGCIFNGDQGSIPKGWAAARFCSGSDPVT
jgi:hypothetical protein